MVTAPFCHPDISSFWGEFCARGPPASLLPSRHRFGLSIYLFIYVSIYHLPIIYLSFIYLGSFALFLSWLSNNHLWLIRCLLINTLLAASNKNHLSYFQQAEFFGRALGSVAEPTQEQGHDGVSAETRTRLLPTSPAIYNSPRPP